MKSTFTKNNQKYNDQTLLITSSTHAGKIYHISGSLVEFIVSVETDLIPYPEKHGQLTKVGKSGNIQKSGMVYEREYSEEISDYIKKITLRIQEYIDKHDDSVTRMIITAPASIHSELSETLLETLHNVHVYEIVLIEGNYLKVPLTDILDIIDNKSLDSHVLVQNIK